MSGPLSTASLMMSSQKRGYRYLRWIIWRNRSTTDAYQLSEFEILQDGVKIPWPAGTTCNDTDSNPSGEGPDKVIDGLTTTKWLGYSSGGLRKNTADCSCLEIDMKEITTFNGYRYRTANDFNSRDPVSWTLMGSNDYDTWHIIDSQNSATITTSRQTATQIFPVSSSSLLGTSKFKARYWKFTIADSYSTSTTRIGEFEFRNESAAVPWPATLSLSLVDETEHSSFPLSNIIDGNTTTIFLSQSGDNYDIIFDMGQEITADGFRFANGSASSTVVDEFALFMSEDNVKWHLLYGTWRGDQDKTNYAWTEVFKFGRIKGLT